MTLRFTWRYRVAPYRSERSCSVSTYEDNLNLLKKSHLDYPSARKWLVWGRVIDTYKYQFGDLSRLVSMWVDLFVIN